MIGYKCAKQVVTAIIYADGKEIKGENWCENPQSECPRKDMPTGEGYELCHDICKQHSHAEVDACEKAGDLAKGADLYLFGHYYSCEGCISVMKRYGIKTVHIINKSITL